MHNTLKRLDTFADLINFEKGITNPLLVGAIRDINNIVRTAKETSDFADGMADHVLAGNATNSAIFKDDSSSDKGTLIAKILDLIVAFAFFYIGRRKVKKDQSMPDRVRDSFGANDSLNILHSARNFGRLEDEVAARDKGDGDHSPGGIDNFIDTMSDVIATKNYEAFDDAMLALQYQLTSINK